MQIISAQNEAASRAMTNAGLRVGTVATMRLTVGATEDALVVGKNGEFVHLPAVQLHFCSARVHAHHRHKRGGEYHIPEHPEIVFDWDFPTLQKPGFIDFFATVTARDDGAIVVAEPRVVRAVLIPEVIQHRAHWAVPNGCRYAASECGFESVGDWFNRAATVLLN